MIFLFDTNAVSDWMSRRRMIDEHYAAIAPPDVVVTCTIVRGEILFGIEQMAPGKRRDALAASAHYALSSITCEAVPAVAATHYARIKFGAETHGFALDENDLWIAATAISLSAVLVTRDKDFAGVPALRIEDWTK